jgi:hypothetical protein
LVAAKSGGFARIPERECEFSIRGRMVAENFSSAAQGTWK